MAELAHQYTRMGGVKEGGIERWWGGESEGGGGGEEASVGYRVASLLTWQQQRL